MKLREQWHRPDTLLLQPIRTSPRRGKKSTGESIDKPSWMDDEEADEEDEDASEVLNSTDALFFPIVGSGMLLGLYFVFKVLDPEWINYLFGLYFAIMGIGSVWKVRVSLSRFMHYCHIDAVSHSDECSPLKESIGPRTLEDIRKLQISLSFRGEKYVGLRPSGMVAVH